MSAAQHTPSLTEQRRANDRKRFDLYGPRAPSPRDIYAQTTAFTETVERFMRADDNRVPPTEAEVAEAMYALRAAIAKAEGSAS